MPLKQGSNPLSRSCPFSNKTNLHLELPGFLVVMCLGSQAGGLAPEEVRNTPSTAGNSMTSSERPSPEPLLKKEAPPAVLGGREFWKCSGSLKCLEL